MGETRSYRVTESRSGRGVNTFVQAGSPVDAATAAAKTQYGARAFALPMGRDVYRAHIQRPDGTLAPLGKSLFVAEA